MTGGGFGGSAIVLTDASMTATLTESIVKAFASGSHATPRIFPAVPSQGATRLS
jgi:galactokinase